MCSALCRVPVKLGFYSLQIHILPDFIQDFILPLPTPQRSIRTMLNFPGVRTFAFYPIPWLYVQAEHKLAQEKKKKCFSVMVFYFTFTFLWLWGYADKVELCTHKHLFILEIWHVTQPSADFCLCAALA